MFIETFYGLCDYPRVEDIIDIIKLGKSLKLIVAISLSNILNLDVTGSITNVNDITIPSSSGGDGFIKLGSYLHIYGRNRSNTA